MKFFLEVPQGRPNGVASQVRSHRVTRQNRRQCLQKVDKREQWTSSIARVLSAWLMCRVKYWDNSMGSSPNRTISRDGVFIVALHIQHMKWINSENVLSLVSNKFIKWLLSASNMWTLVWRKRIPDFRNPGDKCSINRAINNNRKWAT